MNIYNESLTVCLYVVAIILLVLLIVLVIKLIKSVNKIDMILDDTLEKSNQLNTTFELVDTVSKKVKETTTSFSKKVKSALKVLKK